MKKIFFLMLISGLVLAFPSCKRSEVDDPDWDGPAGFSVIVKGSAKPASQLIDGKVHPCEIYVRVTDAKGNPLGGETLHFQQLEVADPDYKVNWGKFSNGQCTIDKVTNANGEVWVTFYWPEKYKSYMMYIHAQMIVDGSAYQTLGNIPQDYIALTMFHP